LVEDMARAKHFYQNALGLEIEGDFGVYVELKAREHVLFALFERAAMQAGEPGIAINPVGGQRTAIEFEVENVDTFYETLHSKDVQIASEPKDHPEWGLRTLFLRDPDGNLLCVYHRIPMAE
jgi:catechol 2,3-dioxygenase-like lactoylglutathione lyase family enzyme